MALDVHFQDSGVVIQLSHFDYEAYLEARKGFSTDEWIDLLFQTVGFDPEMFGRRDPRGDVLKRLWLCCGLPCRNPPPSEK
ncbi:MAG: hypothetical protein EBS21_10645 [Sphingomonadaceae bacterium]|nr:hypothetical protein [Sphingomonadaceae bacterium]